MEVWEERCGCAEGRAYRRRRRRKPQSLAGGFSAGGVAREGSKKSKLGWKSGKVDRNIGAIFWEKHRFVPHGGARAAAMEVSEALRVITV